MDRDAAIAGLNAALELELRSAATLAFAAGGTRGLETQYVAAELWSFAQRALDDARRLVEKIVALGGEARAQLDATLEAASLPDVIGSLIGDEQRGVEALAEVIPATGNEGEGEALEHLLEHMIMRKQEQIDFLLRAQR